MTASAWATWWSRSATAVRPALLAGLCSLLGAASAAASAYRVEAVYTGDLLRNVSGGLRTGARYLDNLDLILEVDVAKAWGIGSGTIFAYGLYNNGSTFSDELLGDLMVTSNIDAPEAWRLYELWYEVGRGPWSVRAGLYDLNSEFDVNEAGSVFLNSSHGIGAEFGQTGRNGPSIFPVTSLALRTAVEAGGITARLAALDGVPGDPENVASNRIDISKDDGALIVAEIEKPLPGSGRVWAGYWHYTAGFERAFAGGSATGNTGWYIGGERNVHFGSRSAAFFVRYGHADQQFNALSDYIGAGLIVDGILPSRPEDRLGASVASAGAGGPYRGYLEQIGARAASRETTWELTYRMQVNDHLVLQPDLQFVRHPGASSHLDDAWVLGLRTEISY